MSEATTMPWRCHHGLTANQPCQWCEEDDELSAQEVKENKVEQEQDKLRDENVI